MIILIIDQGRYAYKIKRLERFDYNEEGELLFTVVAESLTSLSEIRKEVDEFRAAQDEGRVYITKEIVP